MMYELFRNFSKISYNYRLPRGMVTDAKSTFFIEFAPCGTPKSLVKVTNLSHDIVSLCTFAM